ncbi:MAG: exo-alpha-sialidase [Dechloromonas sp.]|nr:exo-alpha-sialidase [Dechloromonas sp.]
MQTSSAFRHLPWAAPLAFVLSLGLASWRAAPVATAALLAPPSPLSSTQAIRRAYWGEMLPPAGRGAAEPSLAELPDGRLAAVWRSSIPGEEAESALWFSLRTDAGWQAPGLINHRGITAGATFARVGAISRPQLYVEGSWLHLWYTASVFGLDHGHSIHYSVSTDAGQHWRKPSKLHTAPWSSLGSRTSAPPVPLADGGLALPISHDLLTARGEWLHLDAQGRIVNKQRLHSLQPADQPSLIVHDPQRVTALLQSQDVAGSTIASHSDDAGQSWQPQRGDLVPLASTPHAALALRSGLWLLAGNPPGERGRLQLWISSDQGQHWQMAQTIEQADDGAADFSSPSLLQTRDGRIHLAYGWRGQQIKHVDFSERWLRGEDA